MEAAGGGDHMGSSQAAVTWFVFVSSVKAEEEFTQNFEKEEQLQHFSCGLSTS